MLYLPKISIILVIMNGDGQCDTVCTVYWNWVETQNLWHLIWRKIATSDFFEMQACAEIKSEFFCLKACFVNAAKVVQVQYEQAQSLRMRYTACIAGLFTVQFCTEYNMMSLKVILCTVLCWLQQYIEIGKLKLPFI